MARVLALLSLSLLLSLFPSIAGNILETKVQESHSQGIRDRYRFTLKHRDAPTSPFLQLHENRESFLRTVLRRDAERVESFREHLLQRRTRLATGATTERRFRVTEAANGSPPDPLTDTAATLLLPAGAGEYYTELFVGTPRQMLVAMVDLASDVIWLPSEPENLVSSQENLQENLLSNLNLDSSQENLRENLLSSGNIISSLFSSSSSSSFTPISSRSPACLGIAGLHVCGAGCRVALTADSTTEFAYEDLRVNKTELRQILVSLSTVAAPRAAILGLGRGQAIASRFAYCLSDTDEPAGSALVVNGGEETPGLAFTPLLPRATFHLVTLAAIKVHGCALPVPAIAVVLDMSTRFSRLPRAVLDPLVNAIARRAALPRVEVPGFPLCYDAEILRVPEVEFVFKRGVRMRLPMENLFVAASERREVMCLAMAVGEGVAVIGATQQQNFVVVVDRGGERVGFAPRQCASLPNL